jgi:urea transport system permease protein
MQSISSCPRLSGICQVRSTLIASIAILLTIFSPGVWAEPISADRHTVLMESLASEDDDRIAEAVAEISASADATYYDLLTSLYRAKLFISEDREEHDSGLVIGGKEIATEEGDTLLPIFTVRPKSPIHDATGSQSTVDVFDLIEVESSRKLRELIKTFQAKVDLTSGDLSKRLAAIERMGESDDVAFVAVLQDAQKEVNDPVIGRALDVAVNRLLLLSDDSLTRYKAVEALDNLHATHLIPLLEMRLAEVDGAKAPEQDPRVYKRTARSVTALKDWERSMTIVQTIFSGISLGSVLVLIGLGLAIIYGLMGVINMAHGEFLMVGAYTTFCVQTLFLKHVPADYFDLFFILSLPAAFIISGIVGLIVENLVIRHLYSRPLESLLATWGISLLLIQSARTLFGDLTAVRTPEFLAGGYALFPQVILPYGRLFIMGLTVATVAG